MSRERNPKYEQFQREGAEWLAERPYGILADDRGLGKTVQILDALKLVKSKRALGIVTKPFVWRDEIALEDDGRTVSIPEWSNHFDREAGILKGADITLLTYDVVEGHLNTLWKQGYDVIFFDEFHKVCNKDSARTKAIKKLVSWCKQKKMCQVWGATGNPIINHPQDLHTLLQILDGKRWSSYWAWVDTWLETREIRVSKHVKVREVLGPHSPDTFKEFHSQFIKRREKSILGLPGVLIDPIFHDMTGDQRRMYDKMRDDMYVEFENTELASINPLVLTGRLKQLAISPALLFPEMDGLPGGKNREIEEIMSSSGDQKIIAFSQYVLPIERLKQKYGKAAVSYHDDDGYGSTVKKFQENDSVKLFLTTYGSGAESLTLTRGSIVVPIDLPWTDATRGQAIDRANRIGQTQIVNVYPLMANNSIDSWVAQVCETKARLFEDSIPTETIIAALKAKTI